MKKDLFLTVLSSVLLIMAYPPFDLGILAWGALVPLLFVLDGKESRAAFGWSYLCGFLFFVGTLYWFFYLARWFSFMAVIGILILLCYLAAYFGVFGLFVRIYSRRKPVVRLVLLPCAWVALEFIRGHLFTGFDWVCLGHSQYKNLVMIQIADMAGVAGVSFVIVMVNVLLKDWIASLLSGRGVDAQKELSRSMWVTAVALLFVMGYGTARLRTEQARPDDRTMKVAVVQADIPQEDKWDKTSWPGILEKYLALTERAAAEKPDMIIWPESSYPGYLWDDIILFNNLKSAVRRHSIPLLIGSVLREGEDYYNAALLLSADGEVVQIYRKVHLVPFGEYFPLRSLLAPLAKAVGIEDFTVGGKWTLFPAPMRKGSDQFSVLICFEDTLARLSREFVRNGAGLLINITNDAWFGDTTAPYLHLQTSVFRTVENRRVLIRAANTGISCFIDATGKIGECVGQKSRQGTRLSAVSGTAAAQAVFQNDRSIYTKLGDVFTFICFGCILINIFKKETKTNEQ